MIGKILGNRYEIVEKIGGGGMALVYKAKCSLLNRFVAVKVLREEYIDDDEFIEKFRREAQAAASLSHPNIVGVYDVGVEENIHYIVMEYIKGKTLKDKIKEKGKLTTKETLDISMKVADAISHAHDNKIIHRDIKPHNIMITEDGRPKVTDFGIARAATNTTIASTSSVIGSVHYFSPEQARGGYTDEKSDIYSLGIMMYELCTGTLPFDGDSPVSVAIKHIQEQAKSPIEVDNSISVDLSNVIMNCIEKNQSLRYSSVLEVIKDLKNIKNGIKSIGTEKNLKLSDSPTQVMPKLDDTILMNKNDEINYDSKTDLGKRRNTYSPNNNKPKPDKNSKTNKKNKWMTMLAVLLAFLVVSLGVGAVFLVKSITSGEEIVVPDLIGKTKLEAQEELEELGLRLEVMSERESEADIGEIIEQITRSGQNVKKGFPIKVTISKGMDIKLIEVPNVINENIDIAEDIIHEAGLVLRKVKYEESDKPEGTVIMQNPRGRRQVEPGTEIDLVVSEGKKVKTIKVPSLVGLKEEEAKRELRSLNLEIGEVKKEESSANKGEVISQSPRAGSTVEEDSKVDIIISKGSKDKDEKDDRDDDKEDDENQSNNSQKTILETISLPTNKEEVNVVVEIEQDGSRRVIYNQRHKTAEGDIKVAVTGKGKAKIDIYIDGETYGSRDIKFD